MAICIALNTMLSCAQCDRSFFTESALFAHCRDHFYCEDCDRFFSHSNALQQHLQYSPAHLYDDDDEDEDDVDVDDDDDEEEEEQYCSGCARWFVSQFALYRHLAASSKHNWCFICSRDFSTPHALEQHSSSQVHKARDLKCPLCKSTFKVPSAIALHIESGCHNITRHQVTAAVHSMQVVPTISITRRLQYYENGPAALIQYSASEYAFNGTAYECYICHRTFRTLPGLNAHLASPAHDADEFKCPKCKRTFKLVSGLIQHIESEICGAARFKQVEDFAHDFTSRFTMTL